MTAQPRIRRLARAGAQTVLAGLAALVVTQAGCSDLTGVGVGNRDLEILWPRQGATLVDEEYLEVRLRGYRLDEYEVYWYVDDGDEVRMWDEWDDNPPHKAYWVDTYFWDWNGSGPYTVGFIAEDHRGNQLAHRTVRVYVR